MSLYSCVKFFYKKMHVLNTALGKCRDRSSPDDFHNLAGLPGQKVHWQILCKDLISFSKDMRQNVKKCLILQCRRILQTIPRSRSGGGWLPKFHQFFLVHSYISGKIFINIWSVVLTCRQYIFSRICKISTASAIYALRCHQNWLNFYKVPW